MQLSKTILGPKLDFVLLYFPVWVGLVYLIGIFQFPQHSSLIYIAFVLILGETHFACTWLFFSDRSNWAYIKSHKFKFLFMPALFLCAFYAVCFFDLTVGVLVAGAASGIHVTRQSIGVMRLAGHTKHGFAEQFVYLISGACLIFGFLRFYFVPFFDYPMPWAYIALIGVITSLLVAVATSGKNLKKATSVVTGSCIYLSYLIVPTPQDAIAIGVGMHWCQYLALSYKVHFRAGAFSNQILLTLSLIFLYASVMVVFGFDSLINMQPTSYALLLPLTGQMLHYYFDAFIWRFSDPHIRETVGKNLYA